RDHRELLSFPTRRSSDLGLVREMDFGKDYKFYDPNYAEHPNHNHIICNDCERIVEFESDKLERLESEITQKLGFAIKAQRLQIRSEEHTSELQSRENLVC